MATEDLPFSARPSSISCCCIGGICQTEKEVCIRDSPRKDCSDILDFLAEADRITKQLINKGTLADLARASGIDGCISMCERQANLPTQPLTLKLGLSAIIAAVYLDTDQDLRKVEEVMDHLEQVASPQSSVLIESNSNTGSLRSCPKDIGVWRGHRTV